MLIEATTGDITDQRLEAIVNAANTSLLGGGGVDGAIHAAAGPDLLDACREVRQAALPEGLAPGDAVATTAGRLPALAVIHTVGPKHWQYPDGGRDVLASCHRRCLEIASERGFASVAFPAISCGAYGWSAVEAAPVAVRAVRAFARDNPDSSVALVRFVLFHDADLRVWDDALASVVE